MSLESQLDSALRGLVNDRVYPVIAPEDVVSPYIVWHAPGGGGAVNFMSGDQPSKKNARIQVNVWASDPEEAFAIAQQVETALRATTQLSTTVQSDQATMPYDEERKLFGTRQLFSCWADIS